MFDRHASADNYFYHYTKLSTLLECVLPQQKLKFGLLSKANDPRESKKWSFFTENGLVGNPAKIEDFIEIARVLDEEFSDGIKKDANILCFSMDNKIQKSFDYGKGYALPRMWAQYADNHRGICLVFNKEKILEAVKENCCDKEFYMGEIHYSDKFLQLPNVNWQNYEDSKQAGGLPDFYKELRRKFYREYFFTKLDDWKQEQEYRIISYSKSEECLPIKGILEGVILGVDMHISYDIAVKEYCNRLKIDCYKMTWRNGKPTMRAVNMPGSYESFLHEWTELGGVVNEG